MLIIISAAAVGIAVVYVAANMAGPHYREYDDSKCGGYGIGYGIYWDYSHGYGSRYSGYVMEATMATIVAGMTLVLYSLIMYHLYLLRKASMPQGRWVE